MTAFFTTTHCTSRAHCRTCRETLAGRKWREGIARQFDVPSVDFDCPQGKPWVKSAVRLAADGRVYIAGRECVGCRKKG